MELDAVLGADLLADQELGAINTVVSLELEDHSVLGVLNDATVAAEELGSEKKKNQQKTRARSVWLLWGGSARSRKGEGKKV